MKICPNCNKEFTDQVAFCSYDGHLLTDHTLLDDKYQLEERIGEGGMGQVYRATHLQLGTSYAIKILHASRVSDPHAVERFRREARATAQIRHPNAVQVIDFGVTKNTGTAYLVMEFLEGYSLKEKIYKEKKLTFREILPILTQVCAGVNFAHSKGIIHRDLKPDNIFIVKNEDGDEQIKVLDFGIAKLKGQVNATALTETGMVVGTPTYMSPEQCRGDELDTRSDIYSLGIILYQMITGQTPFFATTPSAIIIMHAMETPKPLSQFCPNIPEQLEKVVLRALEKNPEKRQQTATQLAKEVENVIYETGLVTNLSSKNNPILTNSKNDIAVIEPLKDYSEKREKSTPLISNATISKTEDNSLNFKPNSLPEHHTTIGVTQEKSRIKIIVMACIVLIGLGLVAGIWINITSPEPISETPPGMVIIPKGTFNMGNNASDEESEKPEHPVTIDAFYIDKYELTNEQYYKFIKSTNHPAPSTWVQGKFSPGEDNYPVVNVSWFDAEAYAKWAGKRLPTEEEWEYTARGIENRLYPWGKEFKYIYTNSKEAAKNSAMPVGSYPSDASVFGVLDLAGNVAEWTASDNKLYPGSQTKLKKGYKIVRGGSFFSDKRFAMVTTRFITTPETYKTFLGFRCAKDLGKK